MSSMMFKVGLIGFVLFYWIGCGGDAKAPEVSQPEITSEKEQPKQEVSENLDIYLYRSDDPTVVMEVYGKSITVGQIDTMSLSVLRKEGLSPLEPAGKEKLRNIRANIMEAITTNMLIYHLASEAGVEIPDASVEKIYEDSRKQKNSDEEFEETLAIDGLTPETFKEQLRDELMTRKFISLKMGENLTEPASKEEIEQYYKENPDEFGEPGQVHAAHIFIEAYDFMAKDRKEGARKTAETIYNLLLSGANFEELALQYSNEDKSRERKGDIGWVNKGYFVPNIDDALFNTKVGDITKVLSSKDGYHIFKVLERKPEKYPLYLKLKV